MSGILNIEKVIITNFIALQKRGGMAPPALSFDGPGEGAEVHDILIFF